ncbi:MAG: argonaute 1 [Marteilia pararefringens]
MAPVYSSYDDSSSSGSQTVRDTLIKSYDCCQGQKHCNGENDSIYELRPYRNSYVCRSQSSNYHLNYSRDNFIEKSMRMAVPNQCNATNAIDCKQPNDVHCSGSYPIRLRANHFDISIEARTPLVLHHYLIRIFAQNQRQQETNNKGHSRRLVKELIELVIEANKETIFKPLRTATDGKSNLYALELLTLNKENCLELAIEHPRKGSEEETLKSVIYKISFEYIETLIIPSSLDDLGHDNEKERNKIHMALDIIMRHLANMKYTSVGRSFFSPPQCTIKNHESTQFLTNCDQNSRAGLKNIDIADRNRMLTMITANRINFSNQIMSHIAREHPLGSGREAWFGYHQSLRISKWKMMLNIDVSVTAFYKTQNVIDFLKDILGCRESQYVLVERRQILEQDRILLAKEIKGLKVEVIHSGSHRRKYKVNNVTKLSASELSFSYNDSSGETREMTIEKYFLGRYGIALEYPHLVCLQVGVESKPTFLPMELCTIVKAQRCIKKLNDMQTSNMIRATAKCAPDRESEINRLMDRIYHDNSQVFKNFGINVSRKMTEITGKYSLG